MDFVLLFFVLLCIFAAKYIRMKKLSHLFVLLLAACFIFTACTCIDVNRIVLNKNTLTLEVGDTERLTATAFGVVSNIDAVWKTDDEAIATVDANGLVIARSIGTTTVKVTTSCGVYSDTCLVIVIPTPVTGINLFPSSLTIQVGESETLTATVLPSNATKRDVTWSSNRPSVAKVDDNGKVTGVEAGEAIITVTTENGRSRNAAITVVPIPPHEGVLINGVWWAERNVSSPGTFVRYPHESGMFFQWNRIKGWSAISPGLGIPIAEWEIDTEGGTAWYAVNDPCPEGWRVPTREETDRLLAAPPVNGVWVTNRNGTGVNGRLFGAYPNQIFLPAAGRRSFDRGILERVNTWGSYWTSTAGFSDTQARDLEFNSTHSASGGSWRRTSGQSIRCVKIE